MDADVIIVGGGAAGMMCALTAAQRGRRVMLLERNDRVGKKILVSGGGRCNFTNIHAAPDHYLSRNPNFCKSALARFNPQHFLALVQQHGVPYHEKKLGQLFCDDTSRRITSMLSGECKRYGVEIVLNTSVENARREGLFKVCTNRGALESESLVIATGGLSFAKLGANDIGYRIAMQFGHEIVQPNPALVPLTLKKEDLDRLQDLSGVSVDAVVSIGKRKFRENILFTHRGLSGPAILQISSYWESGCPISIDLSPDIDLEKALVGRQQEKARLDNILGQYIPKRLADLWCGRHALAKPIYQVSIKTLRELAQKLHHWEIIPGGTEGYEKAEVTLGGVDVSGLSSKNMESKIVPRLYFIGEVVDVTGHLGGFNFQWAWASGFAAGGHA